MVRVPLWCNKPRYAHGTGMPKSTTDILEHAWESQVSWLYTSSMVRMVCLLVCTNLMRGRRTWLSHVQPIANKWQPSWRCWLSCVRPNTTHLAFPDHISSLEYSNRSPLSPYLIVNKVPHLPLLEANLSFSIFFFFEEKLTSFIFFSSKENWNKL